MIVAGVDGYARGWLALRCEFDRRGRMEVLGLEGLRVFDLVLKSAAHVVVVDIPIGLPERASDGPRRCDVEARRLLGARRTAVFPAPGRVALTMGTYAEAHAVSPMSLQTFAIVRKVAEVDQTMEPEHQVRVREGHPELSFREMAGGRPLARPKASADGRAERMRLLGALGLDIPALIARKPSGAAIDDVLDAAAMAWTAARIAFGQARKLPEDAALDARGLRMEIWV